VTPPAFFVTEKEQMSDMTSMDASAQAPQGQPEQTSGSAPQSLAEQMASAQQADKPQEVVSRQDFQNFQSKKDREIAAERQQRQQLENNMRQMQERMDQMAMQNMTVEEQLQFRVRRAEERAYYAEQNALRVQQDYEAIQSREREWAAIQAKTGIPRNELERMAAEGALPYELWSKAMDWQMEQANKRNQQGNQQRDIRPATQTDMGAGAPRPAANEFERKQQDILNRTFSAEDWLDNIYEAGKAGAQV
jgi:hypothetical protein